MTTKLQAGDEAPDFTLLAEDGGRFQLAEALRLGPVLVAFFKTTCSVCDLAFPHFEKLRRAYPEPGWTMVGIGQDKPDRFGAYRARTGVTFPFLIDQEQPFEWTVSPLYDFEATPTLYWITPHEGGGGTVADVVESWQRAGINRISEAVAAAVGRPARVISTPDDGAPPFKPG